MRHDVGSHEVYLFILDLEPGGLFNSSDVFEAISFIIIPIYCYSRSVSS